MADTDKIDIVPELLERIQEDFDRKFANDPKLRSISDKIAAGKASYRDAQDFAARTGELLSEALQENITLDQLPNGRMYYNIAERVLGTMLRADHDIIAGTAAEVQRSLNERAGLGLRAQTADYDEENAKSIIDKVSAEEDFENARWMLKAPVENFSMKVVDNTIKKNADFHYNAGLKPRIIRAAESRCCDWCASLEGTYDYPGVPKEVFGRHNNCRCTVDYDPRTGKTQNVWNKKEWKDAEEYDKIEARKEIFPQSDRDNTKIEFRKSNQIDYSKNTRDIRIAFDKMHLGLKSASGLSNTTKEELGEIDPENIDKAIRFFSDKIRNMATEHAIVIEQNGAVTHFISDSNVEVGIFEIKNLRGAHILHNHIWDISFGKTDFNYIKENQESFYYLCSPNYDYKVEVLKDMTEIYHYKAFHWGIGSDHFSEGEDLDHIIFLELAERGYIKYDRKTKRN